MESVFPDLFYLSYFAILIVRVAVALVFLYEAKSLWRGGAKPLGGIALIIGLLLGIGLFTQIAAIVGGAFVIFALSKNVPSVFKNKVAAFITGAILILLL